MELERFSPYIVLGLSLVMLFSPIEEHNYPEKPSARPLPAPPKPPIMENFQSAPQLSLFPRLGDFKPEEGEDRLPFWNTYRDHLLKISGVVSIDQSTGNRAFSFRGIKGIDSIGHFSPLAVMPGQTYRLSLKLKADLDEPAMAGVGISEFREFLWIGEQYPESLYREVALGSKELYRVQQTDGWQQLQFNFTTGPETRMIHLVLFREGPVSDRQQVLVDDISIE